MQHPYLMTWNQCSFDSVVRDWVRWAGWICHIGRQILQTILCYWSALQMMTALLKEISGASIVTQKPLANDLSFASLLNSMYKRRRSCSASISSELMEWIRVKCVCFNMVNNFNHISQNAIKFRWYFPVRQHFSMNDTVRRLTFRSTSLTRVVRPESRLVIAATLSTLTSTHNNQLCDVIVQRFEEFCSCGAGWQKQCT